MIDLLDNLIGGLEVLQNCPVTFERFYRIAGELLFEALLLTFAVAGEVALGVSGIEGRAVRGTQPRRETTGSLGPWEDGKILQVCPGKGKSPRGRTGLGRGFRVGRLSGLLLCPRVFQVSQAQAGVEPGGDSPVKRGSGGRYDPETRGSGRL